MARTKSQRLDAGNCKYLADFLSGARFKERCCSSQDVEKIELDDLDLRDQVDLDLAMLVPLVHHANLAGQEHKAPLQHLGFTHDPDEAPRVQGEIRVALRSGGFITPGTLEARALLNDGWQENPLGPDVGSLKQRRDHNKDALTRAYNHDHVITRDEVTDIMGYLNSQAGPAKP